MNTSDHKRLLAYTLLALIFVFACSTANAAFVDDFENGNTDGWLETSSGGGSTGVELHNASQMAFVYHSGNGLHLLSMDFNYQDSSVLSFDMHAVAYPSASSNASSGVSISFLDNWNIELGSISFINATTTSWVGTGDKSIDNVQHHYDGSMSELAALAGLGVTDAISKLNLTFFTNAQSYTSYGDHTSIAKVWFDNVAVNAVPIPAAVWLFGSGLLGLLGASRKKMA